MKLVIDRIGYVGDKMGISAKNSFALFAALMLLFGCISSSPKTPALPPIGPSSGEPSGQMPGSDRDEHGCIGSAGYTWCEAKEKCIRIWEEDCASQLRIYTEEFPPFNYVDKNGTITGRSTDILQEILSRTNQSAQIQLTNWPEAYSAALAGPNTMLYSTSKNAERKDLFKWVGPIGIWDFTFYAKSGYGKKIEGLKDAKNASSICVVKNDAREQMLVSNNFTNIRRVENDRLCAIGINSGEYELWLASTMSFPWVAYESGLGKSNFAKVFTAQSAELYFAFSKDVPDSTIILWQTTLDELKSEGLFDRLSSNYFGSGPLGGDRDAHGCIGSAGYVWCEIRQECIRSWETPCVPLQENPTVSDLPPGLGDMGILPVDISLPPETLEGGTPSELPSQGILPYPSPTDIPGVLPGETIQEIPDWVTAPEAIPP